MEKLPSKFANCPGVDTQKPAMSYLPLVQGNLPSSQCISIYKIQIMEHDIG